MTTEEEPERNVSGRATKHRQATDTDTLPTLPGISELPGNLHYEEFG